MSTVISFAGAAAEMIGATYDIGVYKLIAGVAILSMLGLTVA